MGDLHLMAIAVLCSLLGSLFWWGSLGLFRGGHLAAWFGRFLMFRRMHKKISVFEPCLRGLSFGRPCRQQLCLVCQIFVSRAWSGCVVVLFLFRHKRISPLVARMSYKLQPWRSIIALLLAYIKVLSNFFAVRVYWLKKAPIQIDPLYCFCALFLERSLFVYTLNRWFTLN